MICYTEADCAILNRDDEFNGKILFQKSQNTLLNQKSQMQVI